MEKWYISINGHCNYKVFSTKQWLDSIYRTLKKNKRKVKNANKTHFALKFKKKQIKPKCNFPSYSDPLDKLLLH